MPRQNPVIRFSDLDDSKKIRDMIKPKTGKFFNRVDSLNEASIHNSLIRSASEGTSCRAPSRKTSSLPSSLRPALSKSNGSSKENLIEGVATDSPELLFNKFDPTSSSTPYYKRKPLKLKTNSTKISCGSAPMDIEVFKQSLDLKKFSSVSKTKRESSNMKLTNVYCDTPELDSSQEETVNSPVVSNNPNKENLTETKKTNLKRMKQQKLPFLAIKSTRRVQKKNLQPLSLLKTPEIVAKHKTNLLPAMSVTIIESDSEEIAGTSETVQEKSRKRKAATYDSSVIEVEYESKKGRSLSDDEVQLADDAISFVDSSSSRREASRKLSQSFSDISGAQDELDDSQRDSRNKVQTSKQFDHPAAPCDAEMSSDEKEESSLESISQKPGKTSGNEPEKVVNENSSTEIERGDVTDDSGVDDPFFKYDPKENGCQRDGLRVRKHSRAWWLPNPPNDIAIIYKNPTMREREIEEEARQIMKDKKIKLSEVKPNFIDTFMQPRECLKRVKAIEKELDRIPSNFLKGKKTSPKTTTDFDKFTKSIKDSVPEKYANNEEIFQKESFSISDITFEIFCEGVAYGELPNKSSVLKIDRGYKIPTIKNSPPMLVYLISGSARIVVEGKGSIMAPFVFRNISEGCSYSFENTGKETAILMISSSEKIVKD